MCHVNVNWNYKIIQNHLKIIRRKVDFKIINFQ